MLPDRVSNPGPLTYESGALPIALHGPATALRKAKIVYNFGLSECNRVKLYVILAFLSAIWLNCMQFWPF